MDNGVIISLILGGASVISSICFGLIPSMRKERITRLESQCNRLFRDIRLFYEIEEELLKIIEDTGQNRKSTQIKVRKNASEKYGGDVLSDYSQPSRFKKHINN